ncbi:hypothetical protein TGGT1_257780 [Toxoplasma gondii GT1]|uniref:Transmembrane protein n=4 Tax=Toxoplasma gondii TaxID=5811 RepID=S7W7X7_TOXGG|nr:hypothetical protein TGGT1_257780 [Toxoplasma gondii GT1]KAF4641403.1 hypothetical protein TGRH88_072130 [Toxoplasma gondii]
MRSPFGPLRGWRRDLGSVLLSSDCPVVSPRPTSDGGFPTLLPGPSGKRHWILRGREKSADTPCNSQEKSASSLFAGLPCRRLLEFLYHEVVDPLFLLLRSCQTVALDNRLLFVPTLPTLATFRRQSRSRNNGERDAVPSPAAGAAVGSTALFGDSGAQQQAVGSRDPAREGVPETGDVQSPSQGQDSTPEPKETSASRGDTTSSYSLSERNGDARQSYVLNTHLFTGTCAVASALGVAVVTFVALRHLFATSDLAFPASCALFETFFGESDRLARNKLRVGLRTASIWHPLFTVVSVCAVLGSVAGALFLAASAATVVVPFVFGAWARQAVVRRWKKVASLLIVEQKYIKEILRWTQEVAVTHRAVDSWVLLNAPAPVTEVSTARDPSPTETSSGSRRFAGGGGPANASASPLKTSPSSASGASPASLSSLLTAELRRMFVETGLRTGRGLRRATEALLSGVSWGDMLREIWREVAGDIRGESRLGMPSACILPSNAFQEENTRKASLAGLHRKSDYSFTLSNMKHIASHVWRSERDLCAGFQTCLLQLISDTVSRASCLPSSDGNLDEVASSSEMGARPVRYWDAACEAVGAAPEPTGGSRPLEIKCRLRLHQCPGEESTSPVLSMRRQQSSRRMAELGCGGREGGSALCGKPRRNARSKEVKFDVGASATKDAKEPRAAAGLRSLFDELMEVSKMDGGGTASVGGQAERDSDPEKKKSSIERSREGEDTEKQVERDRKQDATGNDNTLATFSGEEAINADVSISPSGISREGLAAVPLPMSGLSSGLPFLSSSPSFCVSRVATMTTNCGSGSACPCHESSSFHSPSSSTPARFSSLAHVFRTAVAEAARTLQALEAIASLTGASWRSTLQLMGILFALKIAERELEKSTGQLRSALLYDWARLAATGVRAPLFVLPSRLAPASSDLSTSPGCSPNGRRPSGRPSRDAESAKAISNPAKDEGSRVVPCCLGPPHVSPLFRDSSALLSPGDLRLGLGRLNQHVAAALALLRLGPTAPSCSMASYRSSSVPRTAGGTDDLREREALSFAAAQLCTKCRGAGSRQDAALLARDTRGPEGTSTASASELARARGAGRQTAEGGPDGAGDEETDAEWIHVLQATQQQLAFAQQSCDKALQLFFKRQRERDRRKGGENDVPQDGCEEPADATGGGPQGEGETRGQESEGKQEGERKGCLALPAPQQDLLEIYKGLGEDDGRRQRPSPDTVPLFNDEVDGATLAKGRLAVGELKRVFLSHPRIQRQRQHRRLVKEFVLSSAAAASVRGKRGAPSAVAPDPSRGAWEVRDDSEDEEARRVRLELREEEGEEDDREDALDFPDLPEWHVDRAMPPVSGTGRDPGDEDGRARETQKQEDKPSDDQAHSLITQKPAFRCGPAGAPASLTSQEEASEPRKVQTKLTEAHTGPEADGSLLSGLGLGETTTESLQLARRLRREAEAASGVRSLFVELSGQLARCGVSTKGREQVDLRVRSFEFLMGQEGAFVGRQGRQAEGFLASAEGGDLVPAEPRARRWEGNQCQTGVCSNQSQEAFSVSPSTAPVFVEPEKGLAALPPVFGLLVRQRGGETEEAFCGMGEAEAEGDDEWDCASWGEAREREEVEAECWPRSGGEEEGEEYEVEERRGLCQRKGNRDATEAKVRKMRRDADCGSVGEWEEGSWCLEGGSDGEDESKARMIEQKTVDETP